MNEEDAENSLGHKAPMLLWSGGKQYLTMQIVLYGVLTISLVLRRCGCENREFDLVGKVILRVF